MRVNHQGDINADAALSARRRPVRLMLIIALYLSIGIYGLFKLAINIAFGLHLGGSLFWTLFIVLSIFLYKGNDIALVWARITCILGYIAILLLVLVNVFVPNLLKVIIDGKTYYPSDIPLMSSALVCVLIVLIGIVHRQLHHPSLLAFVAGNRNKYTQARIERIQRRSQGYKN